MVSHPPEGEWAHVAPLRILSFDIECAGRKNTFPEASKDPIIQIAATLTIQGETQPRIRTIFNLRSCSNIVGAEIHCFELEDDLLMAWLDFIQRIDPDVIIGYNIMNFDFPYILDRAVALGLDRFPYLGRISGTKNCAPWAFY